MANFLEDLHQPVGLQDNHEIKKANLQDDEGVRAYAQDSLDLTTSDEVTLTFPTDELEAGQGFDTARATYLYTEIATAVQADAAAPEINVEDENGNSTGLAETGIADGDSEGAVRETVINGGSKVKPVDISANELRAKTKTVANDASDTQGTALVYAFVRPMPLG